MTGKIILLTDVYEIRKRKEEELEFYNEQLTKLREKMFFVQKEIDLTNYIIEIIQYEKVVDIKKVAQTNEYEQENRG